MNTYNRISYEFDVTDTKRKTAGIGIVVVLHIALAYGLANGLGRQVLQVLSNPLEVAIIQEVKPPEVKLPPPPPNKVVQRHAPVTPPPSYVPPPEIATPPVPAAPTIAATTTTPQPVEPMEPVKTAPAPTPVNISVACPNHATVRNNVQYPAQAQRMSLSGDVMVEFIVGTGGEVKDVSIVRSTNPIFNGAASAAVKLLRCIGQGQEARVRVPFAFRLDS